MLLFVFSASPLGEEFIKPCIEQTLKRLFVEFDMQWVMDENEKESWQPVRCHKSGICGNRAFKDTMAAELRNKMKTGTQWKNQPLDVSNLAAHMLHFRCGTSVNLGFHEDAEGNKTPTPFDEQVRQGAREDRNSRTCPVTFQVIDATLAEKIDTFCAKYARACEDLGQFHMDEVDPETVLDLLQGGAVEELRRDLQLLAKDSMVMQFFEGSHKSYDAAIFELMFWTRCASGCPCYEEFLYLYGKYGKNAKGARIALMLAVFGNVLSGGYVSVQGAGFFQDELKTNKPDEATASAIGARFLVVDEAGTSSTDGKAGEKPYVCSTVNRYCDVAGTPLVYQPKFGQQKNSRVTWGMIFFGNTIPPFHGATEAFKRRPSLMQIDTRFVSDAEFDATDRTHSKADSRFKSPEFLKTMAPELVHWMRRLLPTLYTKRSKSYTRLQPMPRSVSELNEDKLNLGGALMATITFSQIVDEFLELCTELYVKPGRGKASDGFVPQKVEIVCEAFGHWYGDEKKKTTFEDAMAKKFTKGTYGKTWCYKTPDAKKVLVLKPCRPAKRASLQERAGADPASSSATAA